MTTHDDTDTLDFITELADFTDAVDLAIETNTLLDDEGQLFMLVTTIPNADDRRTALRRLSTAVEQTRDAAFA